MTDSSTERTVFIVDDDDAVRDSLSLLLRKAGLRVETFPSAVAFLQRWRDRRPGVLLLDVRMPQISGLTLQDELNRRGIAIPIVFITGHGDVPMAVEAIKKGAVDFIEKPFEQHKLLLTLVDALDQDATASARAQDEKAVMARLETLSAREREVLALVFAGKPARAIAAELFISDKTVEYHRTRIKEKLGVESLPELFRVYLQAFSRLTSNQQSAPEN